MVLVCSASDPTASPRAGLFSLDSLACRGSGRYGPAVAHTRPPLQIVSMLGASTASPYRRRLREVTVCAITLGDRTTPHRICDAERKPMRGCGAADFLPHLFIMSHLFIIPVRFTVGAESAPPAQPVFAVWAQRMTAQRLSNPNKPWRVVAPRPHRCQRLPCTRFILGGSQAHEPCASGARPAWDRSESTLRCSAGAPEKTSFRDPGRPRFGRSQRCALQQRSTLVQIRSSPDRIWPTSVTFHPRTIPGALWRTPSRIWPTSAESYPRFRLTSAEFASAMLGIGQHSGQLVQFAIGRRGGTSPTRDTGETWWARLQPPPLGDETDIAEPRAVGLCADATRTEGLAAVQMDEGRLLVVEQPASSQIRPHSARSGPTWGRHRPVHRTRPRPRPNSASAMDQTWADFRPTSGRT